MTPERDALHAILAHCRRIERLETAMREAIDSIDNGAPQHARMIIEIALRTPKGATAA